MLIFFLLYWNLLLFLLWWPLFSRLMQKYELVNVCLRRPLPSVNNDTVRAQALGQGREARFLQGIQLWTAEHNDIFHATGAVQASVLLRLCGKKTLALHLAKTKTLRRNAIKIIGRWRSSFSITLVFFLLFCILCYCWTSSCGKNLSKCLLPSSLSKCEKRSKCHVFELWIFSF